MCMKMFDAENMFLANLQDFEISKCLTTLYIK